MFSTKSGFEHHSPVNQLALIFLLIINQLWYDGTLDDWKKKLIGKLGLINLPRQNIWWKSSGFCENLFSNVTAAHTSIFFNLRSQKYWNLKMQIQMKSVIDSDYTMQSNPSQLVIMKSYETGWHEVYCRWWIIGVLSSVVGDIFHIHLLENRRVILYLVIINAGEIYVSSCRLGCLA